MNNKREQLLMTTGIAEALVQAETEIEGLATLFRALADPARIRMLNLLFAGDEVSGRMVEAVTGYNASKVSRHFAYLKQAGIVRDRRDGLWVYYSLRPVTSAVRAKLDRAFRELPAFYSLLAADAAHLSILKRSKEAAPQREAERPKTDSSARGGFRLVPRQAKRSVLFLCQSNAARSQMAEAFLRKYGGDQFDVYSAGLTTGEIHPFARQVMAEIDLPLDGQSAKGVNEFLGRKVFTYVITLCLEAEEECPRMFPGVATVLQWPFEDVANAKLDDEAKLLKFRTTRDRIEQKVKDWLEA